MYGEMNNNEIALPLDYQQIIQAINIGPFLNHVENVFKTPLGFVQIPLKSTVFKRIGARRQR